jgi:hypothetical protein
MPVLKSSMEVGGKRPFAEVLAGPKRIPAVSSLMKGVSGNSNVFAPMGQIVTRRLLSGIASGDGGDPRTFAG